ncbi:MAG: TIGR00725 family protein [Planctomycetes bacterium]|nr:TIGR00725 family protein [Planctomycetota bacterium]
MPAAPSTVSRPYRISVIGASKCTGPEATRAEAVGREIARRGGVLICGGLTGVMASACKGAQEAGGITIGILPGPEPMPANPYVTIPLPTGLGYARNVCVVYGGEAVIAIAGGVGTLSEIAYAFQAGLTVVGLGTWEIDKRRMQYGTMVKARTPAEAVEKAFAAAQARRRYC